MRHLEHSFCTCTALNYGQKRAHDLDAQERNTKRKIQIPHDHCLPAAAAAEASSRSKASHQRRALWNICSHGAASAETLPPHASCAQACTNTCACICMHAGFQVRYVVACSWTVGKSLCGVVLTCACLSWGGRCGHCQVRKQRSGCGIIAKCRPSREHRPAMPLRWHTYAWREMSAHGCHAICTCMHVWVTETLICLQAETITLAILGRRRTAGCRWG